MHDVGPQLMRWNARDPGHLVHTFNRNPTPLRNRAMGDAKLAGEADTKPPLRLEQSEKPIHAALIAGLTLMRKHLVSLTAWSRDRVRRTINE